MLRTPSHLLHIAQIWIWLRPHPNTDKCYRAVVYMCICPATHMSRCTPTQTCTTETSGTQEIYWRTNKIDAPFKDQSLAYSLFCTKCFACLTPWQPTRSLLVRPTVFYTQILSHVRPELTREYLLSRCFLQPLKLFFFLSWTALRIKCSSWKYEQMYCQFAERRHSGILFADFPSFTGVPASCSVRWLILHHACLFVFLTEATFFFILSNLNSVSQMGRSKRGEMFRSLLWVFSWCHPSGSALYLASQTARIEILHEATLYSLNRGQFWHC